ncbi:efflux RND transporter permease subunit [Colwellia sp. RSH04]|uniref:efflux RND transporter permease subunit n=1 Tax=Colwellia sp. RSH04 TaxID=2305464 RepID=UPI000E57391D|nr:efflux RND transporter permease subunit [Colwellia sp. RSH04]RHW75879.1 efflux RND transporter permease subunit [Colwellia sp. RSH04]
MFSHFFIKRPIFASVISIIIVLTGIVSLLGLPIDQYPNITPPQVKVSTSFSGATASVASESVGVPLEQELNGTPKMLYMESKSTNSGSTSITVTFEVGTDADLAAVDVQNTASQAGSDLPVDVQQNGVTVSTESSVELLKIALTSEDTKYNDIYLSNYASINIQAALKRIPGVGRVRNTGSRSYSMRIWIRPDRMAGYGLTVTDVSNAIKEQNKEAAAGTIGAQPMNEEIKLNFPINAQGRFNKVEDFKNIMVKVDPDGSIIRLRDIANIELGSSAYTLQSGLNGQPATILQVYMLPGSNALEVTKRVKAEMATLAKAFPQGINWVSFYDASEFIELSINEVKNTLFQALLLVILVVYLFLQNWRTTLIPALAVPVSIIGTFVALAAFGLTINTISLLALVLAIGIVVDDAIVVVESVERIIQEQKISVFLATKQAMSELSGALVATSLVLAAVFVPVSFLAGITGIMYREFAIAITVAVLISTIVALTLSPALCVLFLKENQQSGSNRFFDAFNRWIDNLAKKYTAIVKLTCFNAKRSYMAIAVAFIGFWLIFSNLPTGFIPQEDQGRFFVDITLPDAATVTRTNKVIQEAEKHILAHDAIAYSFSLAGENRRAGSSQANGQLEVILKPWSYRADKDYNVEQVMNELKPVLEAIPTAQFNVYQPSAVSGVGSGSGVEMALQDRSGSNFDGLMETLNLVLDELNKQPEIAKASSPVQAQVPQLFLEVDREKAMALEVPIADVYSTMQVLTGSSTINDFNLFGRVYRVKMQADEQFRARPSDLNNFYVRSGNGAMVPLNVLAKISLTTGPSAINRYNLFSSANINVSPAEGYSSGDAISAIERVTDELLPQGMGYEWTGLTYQEIKSAGQMNTALLLAIIFVFLFLAALYESWTLPLAVLLISPIAMLGASVTVWLAGIENNLFFQVAFISLIGLAAKNSILIVEVANQLYRDGLSAQQAAFKAASLRFRPIMMTAASFILGVLPLILAVGPGSVSRQSISYPILGGMILASTIGIILVPLFFITVARYMKVEPKGEVNE